MRKGMTLGQVVPAVGSAGSPTGRARRYGTVVSVGAGTVDVLPDGGSGIFQGVTQVGGTPRVGDRVELQAMGGTYVAVCSGSSGNGGRGE